MFLTRLLKELHVSLPESLITINCDNKQTIRLVIEDVAKLHTKLRHVDIHNYWLRQEVSRGKIMVKHVPTDHMLTNGLTKALPANK
jgi:hypothetical protein